MCTGLGGTAGRPLDLHAVIHAGLFFLWRSHTTHPCPPPVHAARLDRALLCNPPLILRQAFSNDDYSSLQPALRKAGVPKPCAVLLLSALPRVAVMLLLPPDRRPAGLGWPVARALAAALTSDGMAPAAKVGCKASCIGVLWAFLKSKHTVPVRSSCAPISSPLPCVQAWLVAGGGARLGAAMAGAAQLVGALPLEEGWDEAPPTGDSEDDREQAALAANAFGLLGLLCKTERDKPCLTSAQQRRLVPQLLRALARMDPLLQLLLANAGGQYGCLGSIGPSFVDLTIMLQVFCFSLSAVSFLSLCLCTCLWACACCTPRRTSCVACVTQNSIRN